jgi:hypothetical protein
MKCRFFRAKSVDTRIRALAGLSDDELARLGQVDRYERTPEGSPNRLTVRRKPRDQSVLKMLSPHFSRTYGDRLQHQHSGHQRDAGLKDLDSHAVKPLLVSRALLVKIKRDLENQIRGLLKNLGLVIGQAKMNVFAVRAAEMTEDRPELAAAVVPLLSARAAIEQQIADLDRKVMRLARIMLKRATGLLCWRDPHPLEWQLASLHGQSTDA